MFVNYNMPNKLFIKELLNRRIPQIIGSYIIAGTSLVLFIDWLVARYDFPQYYVTLALFGIISILPSVIILAYFHGAPGKDEWTRIEKIGIPTNILFIAFMLFIGFIYDFWQISPVIEETFPDNKPLTNFYFDITSSPNYVDYYYEDWGYGSSHYYPKDQYVINTIGNSLVNDIRNQVFRALSAKYANQKINIDASFQTEDQEKLNELIFPKFAMQQMKNMKNKNYI